MRKELEELFKQLKEQHKDIYVLTVGDDKKSLLSIAKELNLSYGKVRKYLIKNEIQLRNQNTKGFRKHSKKTKEKMKESKLGEKNPMFGKCSEKT